jgi:hypothetical protein
MTDEAQAAASALVGAQPSRAHQEDGHYESDDASDVSDGNDSSQASDEDESNQAGPSDYNAGYLDVDQ